MTQNFVTLNLTDAQLTGLRAHDGDAENGAFLVHHHLDVTLRRPLGLRPVVVVIRPAHDADVAALAGLRLGRSDMR